MSRAIFEAPVIRPDASLIGESVTDTSNRDPSLRTRSVSNCSTRSPARRRASIRPSSSIRSGGITIVTGCPTASAVRVSVQPLGAAVPGRDDAVHVETENRVVARLDDRGEAPVREVRVAQRLLLRLRFARPRVPGRCAPCRSRSLSHATTAPTKKNRSSAPVADTSPTASHSGGTIQLAATVDSAAAKSPRTEAAIGGRRDDGDEERRKEGLATPRRADHADDNSGNDGDGCGEIGLHSWTTEHGLQKYQKRTYLSTCTSKSPSFRSTVT
jgi:hypothetical protein